LAVVFFEISLIACTNSSTLKKLRAESASP
jgi:hypothetical protein